MRIFKRKTKEERKKPEEPPKDVDDQPITVESAVMITDEANLTVINCVVADDHELKYKFPKDDKEVKVLRSPHIMSIETKLFTRHLGLMPRILIRVFFKKWLRILVYTCQKEGEVTHDPHVDELDDTLKRRFEKVLQLEKTAAKANFAKNLMAGLKDKKSWEEYIPFLVILGIVMCFLIAFQVVPYM